MKNKIRKQLALGTAFVLLIGILIGFGLFVKSNFQTDSLFGEDANEASESPADDLAGALEYEFNMTKDPATDRIPEGIFEAERAQAGDILDLQRRLEIPEFATYSPVGPENLGGRTRSVVYDVRYGVAGNQIIFACGINGGVYKSVDNGANWVRKSPTGDHFSCTSIAQDPRAANQNTWYYTVGENIGNSTSAAGAFYIGNGVYKSTDNGETWARLPASNTGVLENFDNLADLISKIIVNPVNGDVYIAALSSIIRSTDGGTSWGTVLSGNANNSDLINDIVVTSTGTFYASFAGYDDVAVDGVLRSTTGAANSWTKIAGTGSPTTPAGWNTQGNYGRVVLAIAPSNENRVYALYYDNTTSNCGVSEKPEAEFFYWNNANSTWTDVTANLPNEPNCLNGNDPFAVQTGYDLVVAVKPDDANTIFIGGTNSYRSINAGASWTRIGGYVSPTSYGLYPNSHSDIHAFAFQPGTPATMISGNDGGIQRTTDNLAATVAWTQINNGYRTYQYYYAVNDPRNANNKVIGGAQDNGTTRNIGGGSTFEQVFGGDGVSVGLSDPAASGGTQYEYVGSQNGNITRRDAALGLNFGDNIRPATATASGLFITLFKLDPDNTQTLYYANGNNLYRTTSASTVDPNTWTLMAGIGTAVGAGNSITAITMTRGAYNTATASLFIGTSNGRVFRLDNPTSAAAAAATPVNITGTNFPATGYVSSLAVNPANDDTALVTFSNYGVVSVFYTANANAAAAPTWTNVENNLTLPSYRSSAIVNNAGTLEYYVGTSAGLFRITGLPAAGTWTQEGAGTVGNAVVTSLDLRTSDNKLLVGTHGVGMFSAIAPPTAASATISGRVLISAGRGLSGANVRLTDQNGNIKTVRTNSFGYYRFEDIEVGQTYIIGVSSKRYQFTDQAVSLLNSLANIDFIAQEQPNSSSEKSK